MITKVGTIGDVYYCPIDDKTYKITRDHTVIEDNDPKDISAAHDTRISNWRDFHVDGQVNPAGDIGDIHDNYPPHNELYNSGNTTPTNSNTNYPSDIPANVRSWVDQAAEELAKNGIHMSDQDKVNMAIIAMHESGGDPNAVNNTDENAREGHPSKGLVQTIDSTFNAYSLPGHGDIFNPVDNIIAGYRYAEATYGSTNTVPGILALNRGDGYIGY